LARFPNSAPFPMTVPAFGFVHRLWLPVLLGTVLLRAEPTPLETVEKAAGDWVAVRAETARLETEWATTHPLLESTVRGLQERAQALEDKRDFLKARTAKDREELAGLEAANQASAAGLRSADAQLQAMGPRWSALLAALPPRLTEALELPARSLAAPGLTVSERMQYTMTMLNRCLQFNHGLLCEDEVLRLGGETNGQELEVIYWGLGHGYALDRPARRVWFGSPGPQGWHWEPLPEAFDAVVRLMAISRGKAEPEFVEVPARLKLAVAAAPKS